MFVEHFPESHIQERWILSFSAEKNPWLFERRYMNMDFISPVTDWFKKHTTGATGVIAATDCDETQVRITFFKKGEAEHFLARFFRG